MNTAYPLTVFYDGACSVCSREMSYYRSKADQRVQFVNIASEDFCAESYGKTNEDFQRELHVRDAAGIFYTGVEAFRTLWDALPSPFYPLLSSFVGLPGINLAACVGYRLFAKFRHLLPQSNSSCHMPEN
jgi:predicted DCC family thiol-disulfide oxidoreductase YuxK